jgi:hypothetical protein
MIWWFLILGVSTLVVVCVAIALFMRLRRHTESARISRRNPEQIDHGPRTDRVKH